VLQLATSVDAEVRTLKNAQAKLTDSISKINSDLQKGVNQYVLEEVSQLLRMANNSVLFAGNKESAINALSLADNQLKSLSDPRYSVVRSKINEEISQLRNAQRPDLEGLTATLSAISDTIPSLPLANEPEAHAASLVEPASEDSVTWRTELKKLWSDVLSAVQIQRVDQPPKPLLAPQQRYFLNQNLQLLLAKAELSLMQGETTIFKRSITDSIDWLKDYFDLSDKRVSSVLEQLTEISEQSLGSKLPSVTGSYQALQDIKGGS
ncbi:MAG: hypothetical protein HKN85_05180, partial [Gammaproteobacteria bacterium]|nr:hypothetical protein [Gammaproteobacteria bacterium]